MYAVIKAGAHQYRVSQGDELTIDFVEGKEGDQLTFSDVMYVGGAKAKFGTPMVQGAAVEAVIKRQAFNPKIIVFKYKRRKNQKRTMGHKQPVTVVEIGKITQ